jgi:predicted Zn-dependent protease
MKFNSPQMRSSVLLLGFLLAWPTVLESRVTPTPGFDLFSAQEEVQAGQEAAGQVSRQLPILPPSDPVTQYIQRLGQELASPAPGEKWPYSFHVVKAKGSERVRSSWRTGVRQCGQHPGKRQ